MIARVTLWNFYFQIFERTIKSEQIIEFLEHLLRYVPGDILLIWDRLPAHGSLVTQQFDPGPERPFGNGVPAALRAGTEPGRIYLGSLQTPRTANVCAKNLWDLGEGARRSLKRMRRRPRLITAFWKQASLFD